MEIHRRKDMILSSRHWKSPAPTPPSPDHQASAPPPTPAEPHPQAKRPHQTGGPRLAMVCSCFTRIAPKMKVKLRFSGLKIAGVAHFPHHAPRIWTTPAIFHHLGWGEIRTMTSESVPKRDPVDFNCVIED